MNRKQNVEYRIQHILKIGGSLISLEMGMAGSKSKPKLKMFKTRRITNHPHPDKRHQDEDATLVITEDRGRKADDRI